MSQTNFMEQDAKTLAERLSSSEPFAAVLYEPNSRTRIVVERTEYSVIHIEFASQGVEILEISLTRDSVHLFVNEFKSKIDREDFDFISFFEALSVIYPLCPALPELIQSRCSTPDDENVNSDSDEATENLRFVWPFVTGLETYVDIDV